MVALATIKVADATIASLVEIRIDHIRDATADEDRCDRRE
jgi:hypothetical protein